MKFIAFIEILFVVLIAIALAVIYGDGDLAPVAKVKEAIVHVMSSGKPSVGALPGNARLPPGQLRQQMKTQLEEIKGANADERPQKAGQQVTDSVGGMQQRSDKLLRRLDVLLSSIKE